MKKEENRFFLFISSNRRTHFTYQNFTIDVHMQPTKTTQVKLKQNKNACR